MLRKKGKIGCILLTWLFLVGEPHAKKVSAGMQSDAQDFKRILRVGVTSLPSSYDIALGGGAYQTAVLRPLHRNLVKLAIDGSIQADLASHWSFSADRRSYEFCLPNRTFQDGSSIAFEDIEFSIDRLSDRTRSGMISPIFRIVDPNVIRSSVESTKNELCFSILLSKSYVNFIYLLASPFASIVKKNRDLVYSGRYRVVEATGQSDRVSYERTGAAESGTWDEISLSAVEDNSLALKKIAQGELDAYLGVIDFQTKVEKPESICMTYWNSMSLANFKFNHEWKTISESRFRKDLAGFMRAAIKRSLRSARYPLEYYSSLIPQANHSETESTYEDHERRILQWKGKISGGRFRIVSRLNMVSPDAIHGLSEVLSQLGFRIEYLHGFNESTALAVKDSDFEVVFGTWVSSFGRADDLINMLHVLLRKESKQVPELEDLISRIEASIDITDNNRRDTLLKKLVQELEEASYVNPIYKTHVPFYHRCDIRSPLATWQFHPGIDSLQQE